MSLPILLLLVAGLLTVISLVQRLAGRLTLPASILFALVGIVIGTLARGVVDLPVSSGTFLYVFLPALLFQSSLTVDVKRLIDDAAPILLLAVVAVLVAALLIGVAMYPLAGLSLTACLLLGSMVATTDSVAVIAIFRDVGAPARLSRLVEGESLLNDAAAIVLFTVLLDLMLGGAGTSVGGATVSFLRTFLGGVAAGYLGARAVVALLSWLQDLRLAQVTLTLALPYLVYIIGERGLGVSGVVAAVTAGLVMSAIGPPRIAPRDWQFLNDVWEQLGYWASSLIFVLAALLVPRLLVDVGWHDAALLGMLLLSALAARALVLFVFLPVLHALKLSARVGLRYNIVILWGGLRGAITLALALAVTEDARISPEVQRFIAVQATGLTLFTLLISGLTLRPLIRWLGLDRLSALDQALRAHVLGLSRARVAETVRRIGQQYRFPGPLVDGVASQLVAPSPSGLPAAAFSALSTEEDQLRLGIEALCQREREVVLEHFDARTISGRTVEELVQGVSRLLDRVRARGPDQYLAASAEIVDFSRRFRLAHFLHRRFQFDRPLVERVATRFERLLVSRLVLESLDGHISDTIAPLVGDRVAPRLHELLADRLAMTTAALDALGAQYPAYAARLAQRFLQRVAIRHEDMAYKALFAERVIGPELFGALSRDLQVARQAAEQQPQLDLGLETRGLLARVPLFAGLSDYDLELLARRLRPRLAVPGERLIARGEDGDAMFFISSGTVEIETPHGVTRLEAGEFFGEMALVLHVPRQADATARTYCQLLVLALRDFDQLAARHRAIREHIDRVASDRSAMNR